MKRNVVAFLSLFLSLFLTTFTLAAGLGAGEAQSRQEVLDWLESHVGDPQLLHAEDFQALLDKVAGMAEDELEQWLRETRQLRRALESRDWQETRAWLREFLAVQAIYSEEVIDEFKTRAARMSPSELLDAMHALRRKHQSVLAMHTASDRLRRTNLRLRNDVIQRKQSIAPHAAAAHTAGLHPYYHSASPGPVRSSYAERMHVYRRFGVWPAGFRWWIW